MKCPRCNTDLADGARFCGICGYSQAVLQDTSFETNLSKSSRENNEATLKAKSWSVEAAPAARPVSSQPTQQPSWPTQAPQTIRAPADQPQAAYPAGMMPGSMNSFGSVEKPVRRKRRGSCLGRVLLIFILLLAVLAGAWFLGVRPYLHSIAQAQLDQALDEAEGQVLVFQLALPSGSQVIHADENSINSYLSLHDTAQLQNLHATITPTAMSLSFNAYGFTCTIITLPVASGGMLQVTNVQVQGVLGLVMSSSELTSALNSNFQAFGGQMHRTIQSITLHEHEMDILVD